MSARIDTAAERARLDVLTGYTEGPWSIEWAHIRADHNDVQYEQTRKLKRGETRRDLKVGDILGSDVVSIGPIGTDHSHWTGYHLSISDEDASFIAAAPDLLTGYRAALDEIDRLTAALAEAEDRGAAQMRARVIRDFEAWGDIYGRNAAQTVRALPLREPGAAQ